MDEEVKAGAKAWLKGMRPPKSDASEKHVQKWRWFIAVTTGVNTVSLALHIAIACGFLGFLHPGFASAADVDQIREERKIERQTDLEQRILEVRKEQCAAPAGQVRSLHTFTLQKMLIEYEKLSGSAYPIPHCLDF